MGARCHVVRPTVWQSMVPLLADRFARHAHADLCEAGARMPGNTPTVAHCFSNGGFLCLSAVLRHHIGEKRLRGDCTDVVVAPPLGDPPQAASTDRAGAHGNRTDATAWPLDAVVFDSAPAPITPDIVRRCGHPGCCGAPLDAASQDRSIPFGWQGVASQGVQLHRHFHRTCVCFAPF